MEADSFTTAVLDPAEPQVGNGAQAIEVPSLTFASLRLLAECAVGVCSNREVDFYFQDGTLYQGRPLAESADSDVVVPTQDDGKFPENRVTLEVVLKTRDGVPLEVPLVLGMELVVGEDDAVFWSDAAVQKFVFPYVASCGGDSADEKLEELQAAWNYYPKEVTVYALVQRNRFSDDQALALDQSIWVAYVTAGDNPQFLLKTLHDFTQEFRPVSRLETEPTPALYARVDGGTPQRPNYTVLRAMADWACSIRDNPEYFVFRAAAETPGFESPLPTTLPTDLAAGDFVVPAMTPTLPAGRPTLAAVFLRPAESTDLPENLTVKADAAFWSTGAIEQFVFPYYASKTGFGGLPRLVDMVEAWTGKRPDVCPAAPVHGSTALAEDTGFENEVAGLIHLHTSEWTEINSQGQVVPTLTTHVDLGRQLGVVPRSGVVERLDHFIARKRGQS
jgi:hypothetical protein